MQMVLYNTMNQEEKAIFSQQFYTWFFNLNYWECGELEILL